MSAYFDQFPFTARFEWGLEGALRLATTSTVLVVVDVLSFTTCVSVAVERGATVLPYRWQDNGAPAFAASQGAILAVKRGRETATQPYSLSPASLQNIPDGARMVLPSPNGSAISFAAAESGAAVYAACLRNAAAVATAARRHGGVVTVIAAGERWGEGRETGAFRPCFEDLIGAGAVLTALNSASPSPEAVAAIAAFQAVRDDLPGQLAACSSGRELSEMGFPRDVTLSAALNVSDSAPRFVGGAFAAA